MEVYPKNVAFILVFFAFLPPIFDFFTIFIYLITFSSLSVPN